MWDLDTIIRENNRVALHNMMERPEMEAAYRPQPEAWALSTLAKKMKIGPPMLSELLKCFTNLDEIQKFVGLVKDFLPEHEDEILGEPRFGRIYKFCYHFGKKYFPLPNYAHEATLGNLLLSMPVQLMGMSYSAYHDLEMRPGYALLLSLVVYPYEGDERDMQDDDVPFDPFNPMLRFNMESKFEQIAGEKGKKSKWKPSKADITWVKNLMNMLDDGGEWFAPMGFTFVKIDKKNIELRQAKNNEDVRETVRRTTLIAKEIGLNVVAKVGKTAQEKQGQTLMEIFSGARVPLIDAVSRLVGEDLARQIPRNGWEPDVLHQLMDGSPYEGVAVFADWACQETGCIVLDTNYEDCDYTEGDTEPFFKWSRGNIEALADEWPKAQEIRWKIGNTVEWLEADPQTRFREVLDHIYSFPGSKRPEANPKKKRSYYDPTEHWCPLEQLYQYEEDEDDNYGQGEAERTAAGVQVREISPEEFVEGIDPFD